MLESDTDFTEPKTIWLTDEEKEIYGERWIEQQYSPSNLFNILKLIRAESLAYERECKDRRWKND